MCVTLNATDDVLYLADLKNRRIRVLGKGTKERSIPFCA